MSLTRLSLSKIFGNKFVSIHGRSFAAQSEKSDAKATQGTRSTNPEVAGLSSKVLNVPNQEVGSGASKNGKYKNPEYFCYHQTSYFDAELEMLKFRLPQPSAGKK